MIGSGEREGGVVTFTIFIALFRVLKHLNHFKAMKKILDNRVGPLDPPQTHHPPIFSQKPKFDLFFLKPSLYSKVSQLFQAPKLYQTYLKY